MLTVPVETQILFAGIIFFLGLIGLLVRRNMIFMLMSIEVMNFRVKLSMSEKGYMI